MAVSQGRTALYRVFDVSGMLLYVGISQNPDVRFGQHSQTKPWWRDVDVRKVEWHDTRAAAEAAERDAIKAEKPRWNQRHSDVQPDHIAVWLDKLDKVTAEHQEARAYLHNLIADARAAGVPLMQVEKHTPYSREWARKIADRIDAERKAAAEAEPPKD